MTLGNHDFHCVLEERRPWPCRSAHAASRCPATSSSTKWRGGSASTRWKQAARSARPGCADRHRDCRARLGGFIPSAPGSWRNIGVPWQQGETLSRRHRPGLCARDADAALHAGRAASRAARRCRRASTHQVGDDAAAAAGTRGRCPSRTRPLPRCVQGMNAVQRAGRHGLCLAHPAAGLRDGRQDRHGAGARHHQGRTRRAA